METNETILTSGSQVALVPQPMVGEGSPSFQQESPKLDVLRTFEENPVFDIDTENANELLESAKIGGFEVAFEKLAAADFNTEKYDRYVAIRTVDVITEGVQGPKTVESGDVINDVSTEARLNFLTAIISKFTEGDSDLRGRLQELSEQGNTDEALYRMVQLLEEIQKERDKQKKSGLVAILFGMVATFLQNVMVEDPELEKLREAELIEKSTGQSYT